MADRFQRFGNLMGCSLRCYRASASGALGHPALDELSARLSVISRVHLSEGEIRFFGTSLVNARDAWPFPGVGRKTFRLIAREHVNRNPLPPPPPGYDPFAETPRAKLASAWAEASERDRCDLIALALGRAVA